MGKHLDEVVSIMRQRRTADSVLVQGMIENRDRYNADVVVLSPDVSSIPAANRPGPNFFQEAVDGHARIANMVMPKIYCPVKDPEKDSSIALASRRQGALYGAWFDTQLQLKLGRSYRHLAAYGTHAMMIMPDDHLGRADIRIYDPLTAYPELRAQDDIRPPRDCGFLYARSAQWIALNYPDRAPDYITKAQGKGWDTLWDIVEWIDEEDIIIGVMGPRFPAFGYADARPYGWNAFELGRWPNKTGRCTAVVPRRVTLDRIMGQLTAMINYSDTYARMLALTMISTEKSIFPDMVVMGKTGLPPQLVGGQWLDGRTGKINVIIDGAVEVIGKEPGPGTVPVLQMINDQIRGGTGASPLYAGENGGMRTGAGVDALGDFAINPMVAESQLVMERSLIEADVAWMECQKAYFGDKQFTCILGLSGSAKTVTYTPNKDFGDMMHLVAYAAPGADVNKYAVALSQLVATEMMSKHTGRDKHPLIDAPDEEDQFVAVEKMESAGLAAFTNSIAQGITPVAVAARATELTAGGLPTYKAILQATAELASQGPAPGAEGGPPTGAPPGGPPGAGPMPPGMAQLLASQSAGPAAPPGGSIPPPNPDLMSLRHVIQGVNEQVSPGAT